MPDHATIAPKSPTVVPAAAKDVMPVQQQLQNEIEIKPFQKASIQFKLAIGSPDDPLEHEADAMADNIMQMPEQNFVQRKCSHCEEEEKVQRKSLASFIQRKESSSPALASDIITNQINSSRGNGNNMDISTQSFMESRFGADFSNVKIHTGNDSAQMNRELNAKAFTVGNDIYFNEGQYNPDSNEGKHLLAHELTHTVQQGAVLSRKAAIIQRDALDDRAAQEARDGNPILQNALNDSVTNYLNFRFSHNYEGASRLSIRQGGGTQLIVTSSFTNASIIPSATNNVLTITLMEEVDWGSDIPHGNFNFTVGTQGIHTWSGLPAGRYYLVFANNSTNEISGTIWVDNLSGPGELPSSSSADDQFEQATGFDVVANPVTAVAYGQYVLRSEPVRNSFIFGTLPGTPTPVTVIDKRSLNRDGSDTWYKIQFANLETFRSLAERVPPEPNSLAMQMYNNGQAWITDGALKIYIPYDLLLQQIRNFESQPSVTGMTVTQRITYLRQLHQDTNLPYDDLIGTPAGTRSVADRPELSNLIQMLKGPATGVIAPDGNHIDFAHLLITLDAYQHPDASATHYTYPIGSSRAVMSWSGDVGGAIGDYTLEHERRGFTALNTALMDTHFQRSATDADLLGNLDGVGASGLLTTSGVTSIESLVRLYYEGISATVTVPDSTAISVHRAQAITTFLGSYGFSNPVNLVGDIAARNCILNDANNFGIVWYMRGSDYYNAFSSNPYSLLTLVSGEMTDRFLHRMEQFASQYGVTSIPVSSVRAATCPAIPVSAVPTPAITIPPVPAGDVPLIRRKKENGISKEKNNEEQTIQKSIQLTPAPLQIQMGGGGTAASRPALRSVIFRNSATLMAAYNSGSIHLSTSRGSRDSIILLQQALLFLDEHSPVRATSGRYGPQTVTAVEQFQRNVMHMTTPTGEVDAATLLALDNAIATLEAAGNDAATSAAGTLPTRFTDYPGTYISQIDVDLTTQTVLLTWAGPGATTRNRGPFECSTGRGITATGDCNDCDNTVVSGTGGTNCTPKGTFTIDSIAPSLTSFPEALFVSFFDTARGVAFHYYPSVPRSPASHGCVRLHLYPAILIQDNVVTGSTIVNVSGTWSRSWTDEAICLETRAGRWLDERQRDAGRSYERLRETLGGWLDSF